MFNQNTQHQCQSKTKSKAKAKAKAKSKSRAKALAVAYVQAQQQANTKAIVKVKGHTKGQGHNNMAHSPNSRLNYGKDATVLTNTPTSACPNSDNSLASTIALNSLNARTGTSASAITCALSSALASAGTYASASSCDNTSAISSDSDSYSTHCCASKEASDPIALSEPFKQNSSFLRYLMELLEDDKGSLCLTQALDHHEVDKTKAHPEALFNSTIEPSLEQGLELCLSLIHI